jgi:hypothetical protein
MAEKAMYKVQGEGSTLALVPAPTLAPTMANVASTSAEATSSTDRWGRLWKVQEARASCRGDPGTSATTQHAPPPAAALAVPSNIPAAPVCAAPHDCVAPSSFLAPPNHFPHPTPLHASAGMGFKLAELLEHMTEEEALEALGADMLRD